MSKNFNRRAFIGTALTFGALCALNPSEALATPSAADVQAVQSRLNAMTDELEAATESYNGAMVAYNDATAACEEAQARIDEAQARINTLQTNLSTRATSMYRNGSMTYLDVLLGVGSFDDFATVWTTLNTLNQEDADLVAETRVARAELQAAKDELDAQQQEAETQLQAAASYQASVESQVAAYEAEYNALSSEYQAALRAAEEEEQRRAQQAAQAWSPSNNTNSSSSSSGLPQSSPIPTNGSVVDYAASRIGCPYVWAAAGPDAFDCSGLTQWCYAKVGIYIAHYTESQYASARARLDPNAAAPGDILYKSGHVGISTGGRNAIHAPKPGDYVSYANSYTCAAWTAALRY